MDPLLRITENMLVLYGNEYKKTEEINISTIKSVSRRIGEEYRIMINEDGSEYERIINFSILGFFAKKKVVKEIDLLISEHNLTVE